MIVLIILRWFENTMKDIMHLMDQWYTGKVLWYVVERNYDLLFKLYGTNVVNCWVLSSNIIKTINSIEADIQLHRLYASPLQLIWIRCGSILYLWFDGDQKSIVIKYLFVSVIISIAKTLLSHHIWYMIYWKKLEYLNLYSDKVLCGSNA
jgi:hypothetical protein